MDLVKELFEGSRLALARSITAVENEYENAIDIMKAIYPKTGNARILGITGAPGAGKSTLTDKVVKHYLDQGKNRHRCHRPNKPILWWCYLGGPYSNE